MNSKTHDYLQIAGFVGVIAGLLLVALEVRQANDIAIAASELSIREGYSTFHTLTLENDDVANLLVKSQDPDAEFSDLEEQRIYAYVGLFLNHWVAIETAYNRGLAPRETMDNVLEDIVDFNTYNKALMPYFREYMAAYPSLASFSFMKKFDELAETP